VNSGARGLAIAAFTLTLVMGTPAHAADPWTDACHRFYALAKLTPPASIKAPAVAAVDDHYRRAEAIGFSGGAVVQVGTKVLLDRGYGFADWEAGLSMNPDTVFDIGSVSKQFTAAAILRLEEQGRLRLDDPITRFFHGVPKDKRSITVHQLLTHSAGFAHDVDAAIDAKMRDEMVRVALAAPLQSSPGDRYSYSNAGYSLLAAIVEIASGESYETYLRRELWLPAGMLRTGWVMFDRRNVPFAKGYDASGSTPTPVPNRWIADGPTWGRRGSGSILSTMNDLRRWATSLRAGKILSDGSLRKMLRPHVREDTKAPSYYGYGWAISASADGTCVISHNGSNNLHYNVLSFYPEKNMITQAVTLDAFAPLNRKVISRASRILAGTEKSDLPEAVSLPPQQAPRFAGSWRTDDGAVITIAERGSRLILRTTDPAVGRLFTPFPPLPPAEEKRIAPVRAKLSETIDALARGDYEPLFAILASSSTPAAERQYWARQLPEWVDAFGAYRGNELIATSRRGANLVTWILLKFERRTILVGANYDAEGKMLLGNDIFVAPDTELLPSEYVLAPSGGGRFRVLSTSFPGSVEVTIDAAARRMHIRCPRGETELVRVAAPTREVAS
jgi:CubicO group peptidase (beta-lactamase class C family)